MSVALDSMPAATRGTFLSALLPTLEAAGASCSEARLAGIPNAMAVNSSPNWAMPRKKP